nr:hypothetical protein Iba_chr04aCG9660 [Ipomoea batatas]
MDVGGAVCSSLPLFLAPFGKKGVGRLMPKSELRPPPRNLRPCRGICHRSRQLGVQSCVSDQPRVPEETESVHSPEMNLMDETQESGHSVQACSGIVVVTSQQVNNTPFSSSSRSSASSISESMKLRKERIPKSSGLSGQLHNPPESAALISACEDWKGQVLNSPATRRSPRRMLVVALHVHFAGAMRRNSFLALSDILCYSMYSLSRSDSFLL